MAGKPSQRSPAGMLDHAAFGPDHRTIADRQMICDPDLAAEAVNTWSPSTTLPANPHCPAMTQWRPMMQLWPI